MEHVLMTCNCGGRQHKRPQPFTSLCPICDCGESYCTVCHEIDLADDCPGQPISSDESQASQI